MSSDASATPIYDRWGVQVFHGDNLEVLRSMADCSVDSVVTDPPAGVAFMSKKWDEDRGGRHQWVAWLSERMTEAYRVLKPGGFGLVWALPRTSHWTAWALEDAGFEVRDCVTHLFGTGFPKSMRVSSDLRFCQCVAQTDVTARSAVDRAPAPDARGRTSTADPSASPFEDAQTPNALHAMRQPQDSQGRCCSDCGRDGVRPPLPGEGAQGSALLRHGALARSRCDAQGDDPRGPESSRSPDRSCSALRATPGSSYQSVSAETHHGTIESNTPSRHGTDSGSESRVSCNDGRDVSQSSLPQCMTCGKPIANGIGTALKPASEHWWLVRRPIVGTVAANVVEHGVGGLDIDGCRVEGRERTNYGLSGATRTKVGTYGAPTASADFDASKGRWPSNVVLGHSDACTKDGCDESCAVAELDAQSGQSKSPGTYTRSTKVENKVFGASNDRPVQHGHGDSGGASRFFQTFRWEEKAPASERPRVDGESWPTVKPVDLMRWLIRLVTPPGGVVLDVFAGTGTTGQAARAEGMRAVLIEQDDTAIKLIRARLDARPRTEAPGEPGTTPAPADDHPVDLLDLLGDAS